MRSLAGRNHIWGAKLRVKESFSSILLFCVYLWYYMRKHLHENTTMDLKPCKISRTGEAQTVVDRISNLPYELLTGILSLLPTKDGVAASVLCRRMTRAFTWVTSFDIDDSPISYCLHGNPHLTERFPTFKRFVNNVLQTCQSDHVSSFRLRFGGDHKTRFSNYASNRCEEGCFPDVETSHLNTWMCFPLTRNVRVLDLCIHVAKPSKLPLAVFTCETLQVLKLDVNLDVDEVSTMPSFRLPNLKVLHLSSLVIPHDDFLSRLVSSCPLLEDLTVDDCWWKHADFLSISSTSLRRFVFRVFTCDELKNSEVVQIDTPNLEYFNYFANVPYEFIITAMNALREAYIEPVYELLGAIADIESELLEEINFIEETFWSMLSLVRVLSGAEHLTLTGSCMEALDCDELKGQLPVFQNLKHLELGYSSNRWDRVLMEFLRCSPCLETLVFPKGFCCYGDAAVGGFSDEEMEMAMLELQCWRTAEASLSCCWSRLKRIVVQGCLGYERELDLVEFFLQSALVLEELVICRRVAPHIPQLDPRSLETTLKTLPRASVTCSIIVR